jgi:RNA polymerase sigma factor (sigma-70 family)
MGAYNNSGLTTSGPLSVPDHEFGQLPASLPPLESSEMQMNSAGMLRSNVRTKEPSPLLSVPTSEPVAAEDQHLVQQCLKGDEHAWGRLIDKYRRLIYSVPIKYGFRPEDASDVFQTVCLDLFTNLSNLRKVESLRSWLITVTSHKCFHWKKQHRPDVELDAMEQDIAEEVVTPPEMLQEIQQEQIVRDAIDRLPPRCAEMVRLLFFEQPPLPYAEVAKRLGLATGSIGFIRGRCLHRLHKILMELGF